MPGPSQLRILRDSDQAAMVALAILASALLAGAGVWGGMRGRQTVEYEAAAFRPVAYHVNLNDASWPELSQLPGIGETLARRIVESREREGQYRSLNDLGRVHGVGRRTLARVRKYLEDGF